MVVGGGWTEVEAACPANAKWSQAPPPLNSSLVCSNWCSGDTAAGSGPDCRNISSEAEIAGKDNENRWERRREIGRGGRNSFEELTPPCIHELMHFTLLYVWSFMSSHMYVEGQYKCVFSCFASYCGKKYLGSCDCVCVTEIKHILYFTWNRQFLKCIHFLFY